MRAEHENQGHQEQKESYVYRERTSNQLAVHFDFTGTTHGCCNSSDAVGLASWSISNVLRKKSWASDDISEGIVGRAEDPI